MTAVTPTIEAHREGRFAVEVGSYNGGNDGSPLYRMRRLFNLQLIISERIVSISV